ncbi:MAG: hypothetical protein MUD08_10185 [Cytophagales bacterium]|jgi:hypothetical protein|nr:hypothetical protein [Cytophagales bacterium]
MIVPVKETRAVTKADRRTLWRIEIRDFLFAAILSLVVGLLVFAFMNVLVSAFFIAFIDNTRKTVLEAGLVVFYVCFGAVGLFLFVFGWFRVRTIQKIERIHVIRGMVTAVTEKKRVTYRIGNDKVSDTGKFRLSSMNYQWAELHCYESKIGGVLDEYVAFKGKVFEQAHPKRSDIFPEAETTETKPLSVETKAITDEDRRRYWQKGRQSRVRFALFFPILVTVIVVIAEKTSPSNEIFWPLVFGFAAMTIIMCIFVLLVSYSEARKAMKRATEIHIIRGKVEEILVFKGFTGCVIDGHRIGSPVKGIKKGSVVELHCLKIPRTRHANYDYHAYHVEKPK